MPEYLKSLADKFLDFFNIGRAISILIPGSLVAIVLLMLLSLAVFPPTGAGTTTSSGEKGAPQEKKGFASPSSGKVKQDKKFDNGSTHQVGAKVATPAKKTDLSSPGNPADPNTSKPLNKLSEQIAGDFLRVTKHYWIILLLALIIGILLYEIGSVIIAAWPVKAVTKMYSLKEKEWRKSACSILPLFSRLSLRERKITTVS